jgi:hypothetical protein
MNNSETIKAGDFSHAINKCERENRHNMAEVFDIRPIGGDDTMTPEIADTFKAQCRQCKALLRFYHGQFIGEAYDTACRNVRAFGNGPHIEVRTPSELRALNGFEDYTLNQWRDEIHEYAIEKGWWE